MVTVFIWTFRGSSVAWGHAALQVTGGNPAGSIYISWWPQGTGRQTKLPVAPGPLANVYRVPAIANRQYIQDESAEGTPPDWRIDIDGLDETAIKTRWASFKTGANQWSTLSQNCSTTVAQALVAGGADKYAKGLSGWWRSWNTVWSPNDVLLFVRAIQAGQSR